MLHYPSIFKYLYISTKIRPIFDRVFWESTNFEGHTDMIEPWYGTAFSVEKLTSSMIQVCLLAIFY